MPTDSKARYAISTWHGEGRTLFYIVDRQADEILETAFTRQDADAREAHYEAQS